MILIVDDKPENILSLKRVLEVNNFAVDTALSGEEALKKILNNDYALIILDVQMPVMDGFEVAEAISGFSKSKDIPIIFLSAVNTDKKFITRGYTSGGIDYITKPVDPDILILKVKTLHRLYEQNRELNEIHKSLRAEVEIRKRAEDELSRHVHELRSIMESIPQISFALKPTGEIEYVNEQWHVYSNQTKDFPDFHPSDIPVLEEWKHALANGHSFIAEVRIRNFITREYRYHLLRIIPVKQNDNISKWVGTFTDIHQQKLANEILEMKVNERTRELISKNQELESSNHELQQFASVASHDLKEPLRKIQIFSSIIAGKAGDSEIKYNIDRIMESSKRMSGLINDLLNYSRLSVESLFQSTDLKQILQEIVNDLDLAIREKNATVIIGNLPIIDAIPGQMRQVFQNLISNSLKFSRAEVDPVIQIDSEIIYAQDAGTDDLKTDFCRIIVSDNGIGFNDKYVEKIFTIFQRLNSKESYEGTGIGLAIVKKIIDKHNGTITAKSSEGKGASFIMEIPLLQTESPVLQ